MLQQYTKAAAPLEQPTTAPAASLPQSPRSPLRWNMRVETKPSGDTVDSAGNTTQPLLSQPNSAPLHAPVLSSLVPPSSIQPSSAGPSPAWPLAAYPLPNGSDLHSPPPAARPKRGKPCVSQPAAQLMRRLAGVAHSMPELAAWAEHLINRARHIHTRVSPAVPLPRKKAQRLEAAVKRQAAQLNAAMANWRKQQGFPAHAVRSHRPDLVDFVAGSRSHIAS